MKFAHLVFAAAMLLAPTFAAAQFSGSPSQAGGPVAIGVAGAQVDPQNQKVAIVTAAVPEQTSGGIIHLSALGWLAPYADTAAQVLIALAVAWFGKSRYGAMMDDSSRAALETFLKNRASSLIADGAVKLQDKAVHVDNDFLFRAASQATTAIPDALKRFGLTPEVVAAKIIDAIPQTAAGASLIATAHADGDASPVPVRSPVAPQPVTATFLPPTTAIA